MVERYCIVLGERVRAEKTSYEYVFEQKTEAGKEEGLKPFRERTSSLSF
jgi:hypothetical protein